jgi:cbb3-type cytochrome c oxidase subunit II
MSNDNGQKVHWHRRWLENRVGLFAVLTTIVISIGGIVEIVPMFTVRAGPPPLEGVTPYSPLELAGRDIYIREGCYVCHSQMVRPMRAELQRYGEWTRAGELVYDRPFQLGSRRIGPDLQRIGGKYPDAWHFEHMRDPRSTSPGSIMPPYPWLLTRTVDPKNVWRSMVAMQRLGVPYMGVTPETVAGALRAQGGRVVSSLAAMNIETAPDREIVALIAYLQRLGQDGTHSLERRREWAERAARGETGADAKQAFEAAQAAELERINAREAGAPNPHGTGNPHPPSIAPVPADPHATVPGAAAQHPPVAPAAPPAPAQRQGMVPR